MKLCINCKTILDDKASVCKECGCKQFVPYATKRCTFCNTEIAVGTIICPHCHRVQPPETTMYTQAAQAERIKNQKKKKGEETNGVVATPPVSNATTSYMEDEVDARSVLFDRKNDNDKPFVYRSPFERIKDEPADKEEKNDVVSTKEISNESSHTIIYNNYYTPPANPQPAPQPAPQPQPTTTIETVRYVPIETNPQVQPQPQPVIVNTTGGAPKIESLVVDVNVNKSKEAKEETKVVDVEDVEDVYPDEPVYGLKRVSEIIAIIAFAIFMVGVVLFVALPFIRTDSMLVSTFPVALSRMPKWLSMYSNFDSYAKYTGISGRGLQMYNYLPYLVMLQIVLSVVTLCVLATFSKFKPGKKIATAVLLIVDALSLVAIAEIIYYVFDFARISYGVMIAVGCCAIAFVLILVGYNGKKLTVREIAEMKAKDEEEENAKKVAKEEKKKKA